MIVYRIAQSKYASNILGTGAALYPGRWNKLGTPVLYTGSTKEIALLEAIVHVPQMLIPDWDIITLEIPDNSLTELAIEELPTNWSTYPAPSFLAELGENWVRARNTIALKVPSCIIISSYNFLLNCSHPEYAKVKILDQSKFNLDLRLLRL